MKWIIFTGTWKLTNKEVEEDVRHAVREVLSRGDGIVTGGATGVDYFCIDEVLKLNPECTKLRIFIPAPLDLFIKDYRKNWCHAPITQKDIDNLENLLIHIKITNPAIVLEARHDESDITQDDYDLRHNEEVTFSDEVHAFQINNSTGTQDTIDKAAKAGLPTTLHKKYTI
jgi:hypothetical protein